MFNPDFYPTPTEVIIKMLLFSTVANKIILEPSAGKGDIVKHLQQSGAKEVIACEIEPQLRAILSRHCNIIQPNFLDVQASDISHVDMIVMNPPFSTQAKHILHAWKIAPSGCEIISLCNDSMFTGYGSAVEVMDLVKHYGDKESFGRCFDDAERTTNVSVGWIRLFKPKTGEEEFDGYFDCAIPTEEEQGNGIMSYNVVRDIVNRYVEAVKRFDGVMAAANEINDLTAPFNSYGITFGAVSRDERSANITHDFFKKDLQKRAWNHIFQKINMDKYVTAKVKEQINKFVEKQSHVPFTMGNVYRMIEMIVQTNGNRMNATLEEAFDTICSFSADNSSAGEKWKTNSNYKVNKKFIVPYICEYDSRWPTDCVAIDGYGRNAQHMNDVVKALCYLTGVNYDLTEPIVDSEGRAKYNSKNEIETRRVFDTLDGCFARGYHYVHSQRESIKGKDWGKWHDWNFFRAKGYKKGTMHFEFKDDKVWEMFNRRVAEIKGWQLPQKHN